MKIISNFLIKENNNGYLWNSIAGMISASEAVILSMVITRTNGLTDAGVLTIAFAIGNLFLNVGKFGVRSYQISDVKKEFSFSNYFIARLISTGGMIFVSGVYLVIQLLEGNYFYLKAEIIFLMCLIYAIEAIEDVYCGLFHQKNALDVGAKIFSIRWVLTMINMSLALFLWNDLARAMWVGVFTSGIVFIYLLYLTYQYFNWEIEWGICLKDFSVLKNCFPLFLTAFIQFYVTNVPKYAIDKWLTEETQACYGFIAMPVFVVGLLNSLVYYPIVVKMSIEWENRKVKKFLQRIGKQCLVLLGITCICLIGAYILGIPVLSILYATDLTGYKTELLILMVGGGMLAVVGFFSTIMTIMRKQKWIMWGFIAILLLAMIFSDYCVRKHGVYGAVILYTILMTVLAITFVGMFFLNVRRVKGEIKTYED